MLVETLEAAALDPGAAPVPVPDAVAVAPETALGVSVDGAMVPLVGGVWAGARTAVIGQVVTDGTTVRTTQLSYVSHLTDAATFSRRALAELTRRGVPTHHPVVSVSDGAVWIQELLNLHCPQAIRVLDLPHAAGYLATPPPTTAWGRAPPPPASGSRPSAISCGTAIPTRCWPLSAPCRRAPGATSRSTMWRRGGACLLTRTATQPAIRSAAASRAPTSW